VQQDGTCWMSGTTWHGQAAMRISVTNWSTDEADVDRSVAAILCCARPAAGHEPTRRAPNRGPGRTRRR
jgi:hypothetical protein